MTNTTPMLTRSSRETLPRPSSRSAMRARSAFAFAALVCLAALGQVPMARADGTEFVFAFPAPYPGQSLSVLIAARGATQATVEVPGLTFSQTVPVPALGVASVALPSTAHGGASGTTTQTGVRVTSMDPVVVVALTQQAGLMETFTVTPTSALGTDHRVLSTEANTTLSTPSQLVIVATSANTNVQITPTANDSLPVGVPTVVNLGELDVYALDASAAGADLSGTLVSASPPVVVVAGHQATQVSVPFADGLLEQMPPLSQLGQTIPLLTTPGKSLHVARIVGVSDGTFLSYDPALPGAPGILNAGVAATFELGADTIVTATQPVLAAQLVAGGQADGDLGDPSLLVSAPVSTWTPDPLVVVPNALTASLRVIVECSDVSSTNGVQLDGVPISPASFTTIGSTIYCASTLSGVVPGAHVLLADHPLTAQVFGLGTLESYAHGVEPGPFAPGGVDDDGDGVLNASDNCPDDPNPGQEDEDEDLVGDACDNCPSTVNVSQVDTNSDGIGNRCQNGDFNGDGMVDILDVTLLRRALIGLEPQIDGAMPPTEP